METFKSLNIYVDEQALKASEQTLVPSPTDSVVEKFTPQDIKTIKELTLY